MLSSCPRVVFREGLDGKGLKRLCVLGNGLSSTRVCLGSDCHCFARVGGHSTLCCVRARLVRLTLGRNSVSQTNELVTGTAPNIRVSTGVVGVQGRCLRRCCRHANSCEHTCRCLGQSITLGSSVQGRQIHAHMTRLSVHCHRSAVIVQHRLIVRERADRVQILHLASFV